MATKPKTILSTHDGREVSPITKASNVLFEDGQTAQDILNDRQDAMISPLIENSSSMFKVGQGDNVDYSSNVVNGAYESMVLKGKSMVNCIQEPSSQDVVLPYEFEDGQYVTINDTKESGALGVELKGQTLVNLIPEGRQSTFHINNVSGGGYGFWNSPNVNMIKPSTKYLVLTNVTLNTGSKIVINNNEEYISCFTDGIYYEPNEVGIKKTILTSKSDLSNCTTILRSYTHLVGETRGTIQIVEYQQGMENWDIPYFTGMASCKMPTLHTVGKNLFDSTQLPTYTVQNAVVGFGGVFKSLNNGVYTTANYGAIGWDIALEEGQTYTLSLKGRYLVDKNTNSSGFMCTIGINNKLKDNRVYGEARMITHSYTFVATKTTKIGIGIVAYGVDGTDCEIYDIQLEKTSSATSYEPHKSSILSCNILDYHEDKILLNKNLSPDGVAISDFNGRAIVYQVPAKGGTVYHTSTIANNVKESWYAEYDSNKNVITTRTQYTDTFTTKANTAYVSFFYVTGLESNALNSKAQVGYMLCEDEVILRSLPNGVCDTFNTRTGVYTQRIGELVLDGSEQGWTLGTSANWYADGDTFGFYFNDFKLAQGTSLYIDKFLSTPSIATNDMEGCYISTQWSWVGVRIYKTKLPSLTVDAFKQWLSQNHITIQYELATPVVTKINLSSTLKSWNTTTHIYSEIPENTLYPILSHSNPSYPVILKPSTKYSIVANSYSNDHTNSAINFNLGGATASTVVGNRVTTITTPSTLSSELLTMSGRGNKLNNVMVIEGDVVGDEPYFEGICDCKSPILSNVGKNLFNGESRVGYYTTETGIYNPTPTITQCCNTTPIQVSGGTKYSFLLPEGDMKKGRTFLYDSKMNFITSIINADVRYVITTTQNTKYINFHFDNATPELFSKVQLEESSSATSYEPYKSNILSCNGDKIELTEDMFEQGHCGYNPSVIGSTYDEFKSVASPSFQATRVRSKSLVKVKPNTTYFIKADSTKYNFGMQGFDNNKLSIGYDTHWQTDHVFTTPANMCYASLHIRKNNDGNLTPANVDYNCIQLSEVDKTIVLRSLPDGTCDTLNVETGEYVQNVLNYSIHEETARPYKITSSLDANMGCVVLVKDSNRIKTSGLAGFVSNYFAPRSLTQDNLDKGYRRGIYENPANYVIWDRERTGDELLTYLREIDYVVYAPLLAPIVRKVDLSGFPFAYENGHVQLSSGSIEQSLTPTVEYSVATNRNGQIRSNQKMVERHQKQLDQLQAIILANLVNSQYNQTLTTLKYELSRV